jgi:hypothetical protein
MTSYNAILNGLENLGSPEEKAAFIKAEFLKFISTTEINPSNLIDAWKLYRSYGIYRAGGQEENGNFELKILCECLENRTRIDSATGTMAQFLFSQNTVDRDGSLTDNSWLPLLDGESLETARIFCISMIEASNRPENIDSFTPEAIIKRLQI